MSKKVVVDSVQKAKNEAELQSRLDSLRLMMRDKKVVNT